MTGQNYGTCRGCGAQILWTITTKGKSMPCNPEVIFFTPGCGNETFVTPQGKVVRGKRSKDGQAGYISHFATCPQSKRFKKEKDNG